MSDISFNLPDTPENRRAIENLKKEAEEGTLTLYAKDIAGDIYAIANVTKHPDCPDGWFEYIMKRFLAL